MADSRDIDYTAHAMIPWMWNLDQMTQDAENRALVTNSLSELDGKTDLEICRELLNRCRDREQRFLENAIASERDEDTEGAWFAMAARAKNNRLIERLQTDLTKLEAAEKELALSAPVSTVS